MTNILELRSAFGTGGGPEKTILLTPKYLDSSRYSVVIVYIRDERPLIVSRKGKDLACKYYEIIEKSKLSIRTFRILKKIMKEENINVIHAHDYKSDFWAFIMGKIFKMPIITTVHLWTEDDWKVRIYTWFDRRMLRFFSHVIAVSKALYDEVLKYGVNPSKVSLIHNAIDAEQYRRNRPLLIEGREIRLGYVGRLAPMKNLSQLLNALARLRADGFQCVLEIVGDGPEKEKLVLLSHALGVNSSVIWTGYLEDPRSAYERFDIFVLPSLREGLANVLIEAMAMGLPCVATQVGGNGEVIENDVSGILIQSENIEELVKRLEDLIKDPMKRISLGENARKRVLANFDLDVRFEKFSRVLKRLKLSH